MKLDSRRTLEIASSISEANTEYWAARSRKGTLCGNVRAVTILSHLDLRTVEFYGLINRL